MRRICFDTETTGISWRMGDRICEVGAVELDEAGNITARFHRYVNPERPCNPSAYRVHGLSDAFLAAQPTFALIADEFLDFVRGAELIAHNARFDTTFINGELCRAKKPGLTGSGCTITDTLAMARSLYPGARNNLDALCERFSVSTARRTLHGALLDSELLAEVYLHLLKESSARRP